MHSKRVVITGSSGGIGAAGARRFVELGARVVGIDVVAGEATDVVADLTDPAAVASALADAVERLGGLDVVWLNAGVMTRVHNEDRMDDPVESLTAEGYRRVFDVNVGANVVAISAAIPLLGDDGDIVITASAAGLVPFAGDPIYTASKHAVIGLVRSLGEVLDGTGVRIHAVCPGGTATPMAGNVTGLPTSVVQPPVAVADAVVALLEAGANGDAWTILPERPPVQITFPRLGGRGFRFD
ncbi:MAG TPA: SDR family oxidoreductase [Acidimicrobiales bacterium]|nr:SDR family oxidoreductase [Acidimicrobiales bacterium]